MVKCSVTRVDLLTATRIAHYPEIPIEGDRISMPSENVEVVVVEVTHLPERASSQYGKDVVAKLLVRAESIIGTLE